MFQLLADFQWPVIFERLRAIPFCCLIALNFSTAHADTELPSFFIDDAVQSNHDAQMLYRLSGMKEVVAYIPSSTASSFEKTLTVKRLPEQFRAIEPASLVSVIRSSFTIDTFDKYLVRELNNIIGPKSKAQMIDWFHSSLGQRFVQAEIDHSLLSAGIQFDEFKNHLDNSEVDEQRELMILELDKTMQASESAVEMMNNVQMAFNMSVSPFLPKQYRLSATDMQQLAGQRRSRLMMEYRSQTREVLLFTYQNFSIAELKQLNATLASVAGQEFVKAVNSGIKKAMFSASLDMGDGFGELVGQVQHGSGV